jgi:murein DD-endopeptidase MepM/ murein hydrolase activator NlpD
VAAIRGLLPALATQSDGSDADVAYNMHVALVGANPAGNQDLQEELIQWVTGRQAMLQGDADQALAAYNQAIALDRSNPALYYNRALAYAERGQADQALADLETTLQLVSNARLTIAQEANSAVSAQRVIGGFITTDQITEYAGQAVCAEPALLRQLTSNQNRYPLLAQTNLLRPFAFARWPTDSTIITQGFGENPEAFEPFGLPGHDGLDFLAEEGSLVYSVADGRVESVEVGLTTSFYGVYVRIRHEYNCQTYHTTYAHLSQVLVFEGEWVLAAEEIALSGSSGNVFGPLLHLRLQQEGVNSGNWPNNTIDPTPFLPATFQQQQFFTAP